MRATGLPVMAMLICAMNTGAFAEQESSTAPPQQRLFPTKRIVKGTVGAGLIVAGIVSAALSMQFWQQAAACEGVSSTFSTDISCDKTIATSIGTGLALTVIGATGIGVGGALVTKALEPAPVEVQPVVSIGPGRFHIGVGGRF